MASCQTCGMTTRDADEFHPYAFCVWVQAGLDPWDTLRWLNSGLGVDMSEWPEQPPLIRDLAGMRERAHAD